MTVYVNWNEKNIVSEDAFQHEVSNRAETLKKDKYVCGDWLEDQDGMSIIEALRGSDADRKYLLDEFEEYCEEAAYNDLLDEYEEYEIDE